MPTLYFLATDTKKFLSSAVKAWTGESYNHASIVFDPRLRVCYSVDITHDGYILERPRDWLDTTSFALYAAAVSEAGLAAARRFVIRVRRSDMTFSYRGLLGVVLGHPMHNPNAMFCSEFVEHVALAAGLPPAVSDPALSTPLRVCARPGARLVASGSLYHHLAAVDVLHTTLHELGLPGAWEMDMPSPITELDPCC